MPIATRFGLDSEAVLQNVMFARAFNSAPRTGAIVCCAPCLHSCRGHDRRAPDGADFSVRGQVCRGARRVQAAGALADTGTRWRCWYFLTWRSQIVDSIMATFRVDFTGRGELAERQQKLAQMMSRCVSVRESVRVSL